MDRYLCVLGSGNDDRGTLSAIALERVRLAARLHHEYRDAGEMVGVIATGGFGENFNRTGQPHSTHLKRVLIALGVPGKLIVPEDFLSEHTVGDAVVVRDFMAIRPACPLTIVTSEFHVPRVQMIFPGLMPAREMEFFGADCPAHLLPALLAHEEKASGILRAQGGVIWENTLHALPARARPQIVMAGMG